MRTFPRCRDFQATEVITTLFALPESAVADLCGVGINTVIDWRSGAIEIPLACFRLIQIAALGTIPAGLGRWAGWRFVDDRIYAPGDNKGIRWEELVFIDHYRQNQSLVTQQAETIEQLIRQRDWYKKQCSLESRLGLMISNMCGNN